MLKRKCAKEDKESENESGNEMKKKLFIFGFAIIISKHIERKKNKRSILEENEKKKIYIKKRAQCSYIEYIYGEYLNLYKHI